MKNKRSPIVVGGLIFFVLIAGIILIEMFVSYINNPTQSKTEPLMYLSYVVMFFLSVFLIDKISRKISFYDKFIKRIREMVNTDWPSVNRPIWILPPMIIFGVAYQFHSPVWVLVLIFAFMCTITAQVYTTH